MQGDQILEIPPFTGDGESGTGHWQYKPDEPVFFHKNLKDQKSSRKELFNHLNPSSKILKKKRHKNKCKLDFNLLWDPKAAQRGKAAKCFQKKNKLASIFDRVGSKCREKCKIEEAGQSQFPCRSKPYKLIFDSLLENYIDSGGDAHDTLLPLIARPVETRESNSLEQLPSKLSFQVAAATAKADEVNSCFVGDLIDLGTPYTFSSKSGCHNVQPPETSVAEIEGLGEACSSNQNQSRLPQLFPSQPLPMGVESSFPDEILVNTLENIDANMLLFLGEPMSEGVSFHKPNNCAPVDNIHTLEIEEQGQSNSKLDNILHSTSNENAASNPPSTFYGFPGQDFPLPEIKSQPSLISENAVALLIERLKNEPFPKVSSQRNMKKYVRRRAFSMDCGFITSPSHEPLDESVCSGYPSGGREMSVVMNHNEQVSSEIIHLGNTTNCSRELVKDEHESILTDELDRTTSTKIYKQSLGSCCDFIGANDSSELQNSIRGGKEGSSINDLETAYDDNSGVSSDISTAPKTDHSNDSSRDVHPNRSINGSVGSIFTVNESQNSSDAACESDKIENMRLVSDVGIAYNSLADDQIETPEGSTKHVIQILDNIIEKVQEASSHSQFSRQKQENLVENSSSPAILPSAVRMTISSLKNLELETIGGLAARASAESSHTTYNELAEEHDDGHPLHQTPEERDGCHPSSKEEETLEGSDVGTVLNIQLTNVDHLHAKDDKVSKTDQPEIILDHTFASSPLYCRRILNTLVSDVPCSDDESDAHGALRSGPSHYDELPVSDASFAVRLSNKLSESEEGNTNGCNEGIATPVDMTFEDFENESAFDELSCMTPLQHWILPPGKKFRRSLSIIRNLEESPSAYVRRGRHYEKSVEEIIRLQGSNAETRTPVQSLRRRLSKRRSSWLRQITPPPVRRGTFIWSPTVPERGTLYETPISRRSVYLTPMQQNIPRRVSIKASPLFSSRLSQRSPFNKDRPPSSPVQYTIRDLILTICKQSEPCSFSDILDDDCLNGGCKLGEGVFGEVFSINRDGENTVLKIIPIEGEQLVNGEKQKTYNEVLSELVIAKVLHELRYEGSDEPNLTSGYAELIATSLVQGCYPDPLLRFWEKFDQVKGSDNDNPIIFKDEQLFIIMEQGNGGKDLESYTFSSAKQSLSIFKQIAFSLAVAELSVEFEHRDLHWGNVLISKTNEKHAKFTLNGVEHLIPTSGVKSTIIDYSLSRIKYINQFPIYNDIGKDPEMFIATGDYQFDVYRFMKNNVEDDWSRFAPKTNARWLHYLLDKMLTKVKYQRKTAKVHKDSIRALEVVNTWIQDCGSALSIAQRLVESKNN